ncbi:ImuA family protein [Methylobacterium sp. ID0610]|uniref:ImuA family protein n=1 Tax=Methylobacterium carpenticola TaxID=3344827 RepID=UPI0036A13763
MHETGRERRLAALRERIGGLERTARPRPALPLGIDAVDRHLPGGGLRLGALHEVVEAGPSAGHAALAALFAGGLLARLPGPVLWCLAGRDLFAPGLAAVGLHPDRVLYAETRREAEVLPTMEEGLRHGSLAAVVGEVARMGLTASRRLQLAAESGGALALVIRRWRAGADIEPSAAATRWCVTPAPSPALPAAVPGLARSRWSLALLRARGAEPRTWLVEAPDAQGRLHLPADLADRPPAAQGRLSAAG